MTNIPEWAMESVEKSLLDYWASQKTKEPISARIFFARALAATAERVEIETIERSRALAKTAWLTTCLESIMDADQAESLCHVTSEAIAALPLKYQEQNND